MNRRERLAAAAAASFTPLRPEIAMAQSAPRRVILWAAHVRNKQLAERHCQIKRPIIGLGVSLAE